MKPILLTALLTCLSVSPAAFGGIGDTYYCDMVERAGFDSGERVRFELQRFTFRWKKDEIVFGKGGYFNNATLPIRENYNSTNTFTSGHSYDVLVFLDGRFRYSIVSPLETDFGLMPEIKWILANCSKFDD